MTMRRRSRQTHLLRTRLFNQRLAAPVIDVAAQLAHRRLRTSRAGTFVEPAAMLKFQARAHRFYAAINLAQDGSCPGFLRRHRKVMLVRSFMEGVAPAGSSRLRP